MTTRAAAPLQRGHSPLACPAHAPRVKADAHRQAIDHHALRHPSRAPPRWRSVLIIAAERDSLIPLAATRKTAVRIARCQLETLPIGHFDLYEGLWFERSIALQIAFLRQHLWL